LAKIAFEWMMREAKACGLDIDTQALQREIYEVGAAPDPGGSLHVSLKGVWWLGELLPIRRFSWDDKQWHWHWLKGAYNQPRDLIRSAKNPYVALHESVITRIKTLGDYRPPNLPHDEATLRATFRIET
jgi:hypothetical protein